MKRILRILFWYFLFDAFILGYAGFIPGMQCASAQNFTNVTATVVDPNGIPYANATVIFILGPLPFSSPPSITAISTPISGVIGPFVLSPTGVLNTTVPSNAAITPGSTQWTATVCPPIGTGHIDYPIPGGNCFTSAASTISGSSQDISVQLQAAAGPLTSNQNLSRIFNTLPAATIVTAANNFTVTMVTTPTIPAIGTTYRFHAYASETVIGASCAGNPVVAIAVKWQDPNEASAASTTQNTYTITTNGALGRLTPVLTTPLFTFTAKAGTAVQYTATFTAGGSCSPNPTVQIFPTLEQM